MAVHNTGPQPPPHVRRIQRQQKRQQEARELAKARVRRLGIIGKSHKVVDILPGAEVTPAYAGAVAKPSTKASPATTVAQVVPVQIRVPAATPSSMDYIRECLDTGSVLSGSDIEELMRQAYNQVLVEARQIDSEAQALTAQLTYLTHRLEGLERARQLAS